MSKGRIAILEDDTTLVAALKSAFEKKGYEVFHSARSEEIRDYLQKNSVNTLYVDCLLPGDSGVDFVESIRKQFPPSVLDVVMMSGLFTDSGFIKDTLRSTQAVAFLKKPFDLEDALGHAKETGLIRVEKDEDLAPRKALYLLFNKPKVSSREKRKAIEALDEIHGFDLPYIYSLLVETQATGHLNIVGNQGELSGISFSQGKIVNVDVADQETYLGNLLLESGSVLPGDLTEALSIRSSKRIGEKLIQGNLISPHAFNAALASQMNIRLSRTIVDASVKVNFVASEVELTFPHIDSDALSVFLHDWIASKISSEWLKTHYMQWGDYPLTTGPSYNEDQPVLQMPLVASFSGFIESFTKAATLNVAFDQKKYPEETALKALHLLLTKGLLVFGERTVQIGDEERLRSLKKILSQLQGKNKLESWDFLIRLTNVSDGKPDSVEAEVERMMGAVPDASSTELSQAYAQVKKSVQAAITFARSGNRESMKEEMARADVEQKIKAAAIYEEAKNNLQRAQFSKAAELIQKAMQLDHHLERSKLYMAWAKLGLAEGQSTKIQVVREVEMDLVQVPPEERYDVLYSFVMGLLLKAKGDFFGAQKAMEKASHLDPNFIPARRELNMLQKSQAPKKDVMNRDLKDLVAGFFKKK